MTSRDRIAAGACGLAIVVAIFGVGGATRSVQAVVAGLAAIALVPHLRSGRGLAQWSPLLVLLAVAAAWTAVQIVPLPGVFVDWVSPTLSSYREGGAAIANVPVWSTLSMDPAATLRSLTFLLTLSGIALVCLRVATSERGRFMILAFIAGSIAVTALVAGAHELFGASQLYGVYAPAHATPPLMGPLLNANHLGCLCAVGVVLCVALAIYPKQSTARRLIWVTSGGACLAALLATLSRGAVLAACAGLIVALGAIVGQRVHLTKRSRRRRQVLLSRTVPVGIIIAAILVIAIVFSAGSVVQQLEQTTLQELHEPKSKFEAWRSSLALISESPWVGIGRGAFESVFTRVHPASALVTYSHVENEALQATIEWGIPMALVLGTVTAWLVLLAGRRWRDSPLTAGAIGALVVVAFQSNFDFGMELLGLAAPVTAVAATVGYVPLRELPDKKTRLSARALHALVILVGGLLVLHPATSTVEEDHAILRATPSHEDISAAISRHPLDYYGYAVLAQQLLRDDDVAAIPTLNHAMRLNPNHGGLHRIAARLLVRMKRLSQAEAEYAASIRGSADPRPVILEMISVLPPERAASALPLELDVDLTVRTVRAAGNQEVALRWLERLLVHRGDLHPVEVLYELAMEEGRLDLATRASRRRCELMPGPQCRLALARVLTRAGKTEEVVDVLSDVASWHGRRGDQLEAWLTLCDAFVTGKDLGEAHHCLRRLEGSGLIAPGDPRVQRRLDELPPLPFRELSGEGANAADPDQ